MISVICVSDRPALLPILVWSLVAQTHQDWELLILDQSEDGNATRHVRDLRRDSRIAVERVARIGDWGMSVKERAALTKSDGNMLMFPNDDAYYVPRALAHVARYAAAGADLVLFGWLYDLFDYAPMPPNPHVGHVDVGGFAVRQSVFASTGWPTKDQTGDGQMVEHWAGSGIQVGMCPNTLYVKN